MSEHRGGTDSVHEVTLASAVQAAWWGVQQAEVGATAPLEVSTLFVGEGAAVKAEVRTKDGKTLGSVSGKIAAGRWSGEFVLPERSEGELYFEAELPKHGLKARSGLLTVRPRRVLENAKWDRAEARRGDVVKMTTDARKFTDGAEVKLSIYEHDDDGGHDFVTELTGEVVSEKVDVDWAYEYHDETLEIPTDPELGRVGKKYAHPEYFFVARAAGKEAKSGLLKFQDWIRICLVDDSKNPIPDEEYVLTLPDGSERRGKLGADGAAVEKDIPPGPVEIEFPGVA